MLVLSRNKGDAVMIGDDIFVTVVDIAGNRVRFGIEAPRERRIVALEDPDQQIILLGGDVPIQVVDIRGGKVRIGIISPKNLAVHRREVYEQIRQENTLARTSSLPPPNPIKAMRDDIATALVLKFSEAAEPMIDEIRQISDMDILRRIAAAIATATTIDEIRRVWRS